jgi:acetyl-CoA carboxylase biotin carboxyl carrier protein
MSKDQNDDVLAAVAQEAHALLGKVGGPVRRISVRAGEHHVEIEWEPRAAGKRSTTADAPAAAAAAPDGAEPGGGGHVITAPLVGTFYRSPEPGAPAYIQEGDVVEAEQEIAIIEAMKIMNRIVADVPGRVARILVADGDMVEFGQPLIQLEPPDAAS